MRKEACQHVIAGTTEAQKSALCPLQKQGVKWAIAGRNQKKLESVREELAKIDPSVKVLSVSKSARNSVGRVLNTRSKAVGLI